MILQEQISEIQFYSRLHWRLIYVKLTTKIWAREYIDLGCLLNKKQSKVKFQPTETSEGGMAWEKQQPPTYRFENISHWLSAFHIFVSIYSEKYPKETGSLMKYAI